MAASTLNSQTGGLSGFTSVPLTVKSQDQSLESVNAALDTGLYLWQTVIPYKKTTKRKYVYRKNPVRQMAKNQKFQSRLESAAG